jgi:hypothetical protein
LFKQGAVSINSEKIPEFGSKMEVATDDVVKVGKRIWFKIKILK